MAKVFTDSRKGSALLIVIALVLALIGGAYFLFSRQKTTTTEELVDVSQEGSAATSEDLQKSSAVKEIVIQGEEYSFSPDLITLSRGDRVRLTFKNTGSMPHNFVIDNLGVVTKTISAGASDTLEFTVTESGTFTFYCSIGSHRSQGMEGTLEVK